MSYIFLDESGDLGFDFRKKKTSRFFVITFIFTRDKTALQKIVSEVLKRFNNTQRRSRSGIIHAYKEDPETRHTLLNIFHNKKCASIITIYLDKKKDSNKLHIQKHLLYAHITNTLLSRACTKKLIPTDKRIHLIASQRETSKFLNRHFSSYLKTRMKNSHNIDIEVRITHPSTEKGLQIADIISWSIFRKYEHL